MVVKVSRPSECKASDRGVAPLDFPIVNAVKGTPCTQAVYFFFVLCVAPLKQVSPFRIVCDGASFPRTARKEV